MALSLIPHIPDGIANAMTSRLEIQAYSNSNRTKRVLGKGFVAPINPASIQIEYRNTLSGEEGLNSTGAKLNFANNEADRISFKLILTDSSVFHYTGRNLFTFYNNYEQDSGSHPLLSDSEIGDLNSFSKLISNGIRDGHVAIAIERFLNLTTQKVLAVNKKKPQENQEVYLGIVWGRIFTRPVVEKINAKRNKIYPCYLESVDINYTQFTRDGRALRAELDCVFREDTTQDTVVAGGGPQQSSDNQI